MHPGAGDLHHQDPRQPPDKPRTSPADGDVTGSRGYCRAIAIYAACLLYTSIGLSAALIAAAFEEVDGTPMEGFDPKALDEILSLAARGLRSVAILPLGYRQEEGDWLVKLKKVRRPREQFVTEV